MEEARIPSKWKGKSRKGLQCKNKCSVKRKRKGSGVWGKGNPVGGNSKTKGGKKSSGDHLHEGGKNLKRGGGKKRDKCRENWARWKKPEQGEIVGTVKRKVKRPNKKAGEERVWVLK